VVGILDKWFDVGRSGLEHVFDEVFFDLQIAAVLASNTQRLKFLSTYFISF
jgi:hypothetical protein